MTFRAGRVLSGPLTALLALSGCFNDPSDVSSATEGTSGGGTTVVVTGGVSSSAASEVTSAGMTDPTGSSGTSFTGSSTTVDPTLDSSSTGPVSCENGEVDVGELCFGPHQVLGESRQTAVLLLEDFSGDGELDLAAGHNDGVSIRYGRRNGLFEKELWQGTTDAGVLGLAAATGLGAGVVDLLATVPDGGVIVRFASPIGSEALPTPLDSLPADEPYGLTFGPFGGGTLQGAFTDVGTQSVRLLQVDINTMSLGASLPSGTLPQRLTHGDLDGTTENDIVAVNLGANTLTVFLDPGLGSPAVTLPTNGGPRDVGIGDINDDGNQDIIVAHDVGTVGVWHGDGGGGFAAPTFVTVGGGPRALAIADLDSDGIDDVAVALETAGAVAVLRGGDQLTYNGDLFATLSSPSSIVAADVNNDMAIDLITASSSMIGQGIALVLATP